MKNVSVTDVNNKLPRFGMIYPLRIKEDIDIGKTITKLTATDLDTDSLLRFRIDFSKSEARDETGRSVDIATFDWRSLFRLNEVDGELKTAGRLDRELIQVFFLN